MQRVEKDGYVLWEAWVNQNNKEAAWIRALQERVDALEQVQMAQQHGLVPEKLTQALALLKEAYRWMSWADHHLQEIILHDELIFEWDTFLEKLAAAVNRSEASQ